MNEGRQMNAELPSGGDIIEPDTYQLVDELSTADVERLLPILGLTTLRNSEGPEKFELRLWTNLGGFENPKLLGVRSSGGDNNAYFFEINKSTHSIEAAARERLANPRAGWNKTLFEVRSRLTSPKGLVRDPQFELSRDEPLILLEVLEKGNYRRVFYGHKTSFPDGTRLMAVCEYLASEFDVDMNCRPERE